MGMRWFAVVTEVAVNNVAAVVENRVEINYELPHKQAFVCDVEFIFSRAVQQV